MPIILISIVVVIILGGYIVDYFNYVSSYKNEDVEIKSTKMTWDTFNKLYIVNPNRWGFFNGSITDYKDLWCFKKRILNYYYKGNKTDIIAIYFNFFDYQKFKKFIKNNKKQMQLDIENKALISILETTQKDIDYILKENDKTTEEKSIKVIY